MSGFRKISIITPTHNRRKSLQRLVESISKQDYPLSHIELIVVCDACTDDTLHFLKNCEAPFALKYVEQPGLGAANARNIGAGLAGGEQLIFLDDDIEPSVGMVSAHVGACSHERSVVVGYLPMEVMQGAGFYQILLTRWWEDKYYKMGRPGYRHQFEDLLSGNFSLMASLFKEIGGFNPEFRCREDYELGYRLIIAGASICFSKKAWGYHRDEVTNQTRSHQRKRLEGYWDVSFARLHPKVIRRLRLGEMRHPSMEKRLKIFMTFYLPLVTDTLAHMARVFMVLFERMKMRGWWQRTDKKLHAYWYMRGVGDHVKNWRVLKDVFMGDRIIRVDHFRDVDLSGGIDAAAQQLDALQAPGVRLHFNGKLVGKIKTRPGEEIIQGKHLVPLLGARYAWEMMEAIAMQEICHPKTAIR
jgi:glycosyltransferase involved in cell wall biosynthesis